ncbi:MAG: hypothetical protein ACPG4W_05820 [Flavobacteriales bacterium]
MQLLKTRHFSAYFSDTFSFFRANFHHLIATFSRVLWPFLLIQGFAMFYQNEMSLESLNSFDQFDAFSNLGLATILYYVSSILLSVFSYSFMPLYMQLHLRKGAGNFDHLDIWEGLKAQSTRITYLILALILVAIPAYITLGIVVLISLITIFGFFIIIGFTYSYFQLLWFHHLNHNEHNPFDSLGETFKHYKDNFWAIVGSTTILLFVFIAVFTSLFLAGTIFVTNIDFSDLDPNFINPEELIEKFTTTHYVIFQIALYALMFYVSLILQIQQGLVYYSSQENQHNTSLNESIDQF